ncbi:MAG: hypothetical protein AAB955_02735 [Patescibacteria group bacterium]
MNKLTKVALVGIVMLGFAAPAYASHSWGNYHWARAANPFTLKLGDAVTPAWDQYLAEASADWTASSVLNTTIVPSTVNPRTCKATAGRIEVCNSKYGNNGWLGIATIWADGNAHITRATTKLNDSYFNTPTYNTPAWRRLVTCQEIAHDFGLDHQDEAFANVNLGTCMDYTNDPDGGGAYGPSNEHPNAHDYEQLVTMYTHTDSYTTVNALAAQIRAMAKTLVVVDDQDDDLGEAVGHDEHGNPNKFVKTYGNGTTKLTHVFWLPE